MGENEIRYPSSVEVRTRIDCLIEWIEDRNWEGFDPYDGIRTLPFRSEVPRLRQMQIQLLKRSPVNLRRIFRAEPYSMSKSIALGLMAMHSLGDLDRASVLQSRLLESRLDSGLWGYEFDVQTRWSYYPSGTPNAIATSFALHALLDGQPDKESVKVLGAAADALQSRFLTSENGQLFFRYADRSDVLVHNANLLTAAALARISQRLNVPEWADVARAASNTSLMYQTRSGAWPYGEGKNLSWVDGIHTAYVLVALDWLNEADDQRLESGRQLYLEQLFDPRGQPLARSGGRVPGDVHTVATALWALSRFGGNPAAKRAASLTYAWSEKLRKKDGSYAQSNLNPISYMRWGQAHMLLGLASFLQLLERSDQ